MCKHKRTQAKGATPTSHKLSSLRKLKPDSHKMRCELSQARLKPPDESHRLRFTCVLASVVCIVSFLKKSRSCKGAARHMQQPTHRCTPDNTGPLSKKVFSLSRMHCFSDRRCRASSFKRFAWSSRSLFALCCFTTPVHTAGAHCTHVMKHKGRVFCNANGNRKVMFLGVYKVRADWRRGRPEQPHPPTQDDLSRVNAGLSTIFRACSL